MATPLPPRDHTISLEDAARATAARRAKDKGKPDAEKVFAFNKEALERLLHQGGCAGMRAYPGTHEDGENTWVLVGVDEKGNDMENGVLLQDPLYCPIYCPDGDQLNGNG